MTTALKLKNLRYPPPDNLLKPDEAESIRFPLFIFENTDNKKIGIIDAKSSLNVNQEGVGSLNKFGFTGADNYQLHYTIYLQTFLF